MLRLNFTLTLTFNNIDNMIARFLNNLIHWRWPNYRAETFVYLYFWIM